MSRIPITSPEAAFELDEAELLEGYRDGCAGEPEPGDNRSMAYWHGWRNGSVDSGHRTKDEAQAALAKAYLAPESQTISGGEGKGFRQTPEQPQCADAQERRSGGEP